MKKVKGTQPPTKTKLRGKSKLRGEAKPRGRGRLRAKTGQRQKKPKLIAVILVGLAMFLAGSSYLVYQKTVLSFNTSFNTNTESPTKLLGRPGEPETGNQQLSPPTKIEIPKLNIALPITISSISEKGVWEISETGASFLNLSAIPGSGSNTVIYGHNKKHLFGPLVQIKIGDEIIISTENSQTKNYQVQEILTVTPDEISVILPAGEETLTVYTCTGLLDSKRFVVRARPL